VGIAVGWQRLDRIAGLHRIDRIHVERFQTNLLSSCREPALVEADPNNPDNPDNPDNPANPVILSHTARTLGSRSDLPEIFNAASARDAQQAPLQFSAAAPVA
jgi:hypothetical protein